MSQRPGVHDISERLNYQLHSFVQVLYAFCCVDEDVIVVNLLYLFCIIPAHPKSCKFRDNLFEIFFNIFSFYLSCGKSIVNLFLQRLNCDIKSVVLVRGFAFNFRAQLPHCLMIYYYRRRSNYINVLVPERTLNLCIQVQLTKAGNQILTRLFVDLHNKCRIFPAHLLEKHDELRQILGIFGFYALGDNRFKNMLYRFKWLYLPLSIADSLARECVCEPDNAHYIACNNFLHLYSLRPFVDRDLLDAPRDMLAY